MSKIISEENPSQDSKAPSGPQGQGASGGDEKIRKQARQLAYDVRYKVKQGFKDGQKTDEASLKRAFLSQLGSSPAPGPVKELAKKMLVGEAYDFTDIDTTVSNTISNVFNKVFVEGIQEEAEPVEEEVGKYKIRVTDKKTGRSYVRMADRAKISELRKNPNIASVEMTGYGSPYEGEKKKGESTSKVKSGKGLSKKDYDGDGKKETPEAEYKGSKDKAIKKAVAKEEVIQEKPDIGDILARLEKKRISKGGNPDDSPLPAMKKYHAKKKKVKKGDWIGPPPKKQETKEEVVQEADSLAAQTARWEANRQRRMKKSGSYERPNWIQEIRIMKIDMDQVKVRKRR